MVTRKRFKIHYSKIHLRKNFTQTKASFFQFTKKVTSLLLKVLPYANAHPDDGASLIMKELHKFDIVTVM